MGAPVDFLIRLAEFHSQGLLPSGAFIVELGAQNLSSGPQGYRILSKVMDYFREQAGLRPHDLDRAALIELANGGAMSRCAALCGFQYLALDIFRGPGTRLFDLNWDSLGPDLVGIGDVVTNLGTTEHVLNQFRCFETMHELTKSGGLMIHEPPITGYYDHGYFSYHPMLFRHLARANDYRVAAERYSFNSGPIILPDAFADTGYGPQYFYNAGGTVALQKSSERNFMCPVETGTSLAVDAQFLSAQARNSAAIAAGLAVALEPARPIHPTASGSAEFIAALWRECEDIQKEPIRQVIALVRASRFREVTIFAVAGLSNMIAIEAIDQGLEVRAIVHSDVKLHGLILGDARGRPITSRPVVSLKDAIATGSDVFIIADFEHEQADLMITALQDHFQSQNRNVGLFAVTGLNGLSWKVARRS